MTNNNENLQDTKQFNQFNYDTIETSVDNTLNDAEPIDCSTPNQFICDWYIS